MASPYYNLDSKLERAVCAYLVSKQCGSRTDILPFEWEGNRPYPNTTVTCGIAVPEALNSGIFRIPLQISIKGSAAIEAGQPKANARVQFDQRIAQTCDALFQQYTDPAEGHTQTLVATADDITTAGRALAIDQSNGTDPDAAQLAANNADMVEFTCQGWFERGFGKGNADAQGCSWERVLMFEAIAVATAIS